MAERQLAVGILLTLTLGLRLLAASQARTWEHGDGIRREGFGFGVVLRLLVFVIGVVGSLVWAFQPALLPCPLPVPGWLGWTGLVLAEAGLLLLVWVHMALGVHFSGTLHLRADHQLVVTGPYQWVRHPMYSAFLLLFTGVGELTGDALIGGALIAALGWVLGIRLEDEEAMLAERFGPAWARYRAGRGAIFPRWRA